MFQANQDPAAQSLLGQQQQQQQQLGTPCYAVNPLDNTQSSNNNNNNVVMNYAATPTAATAAQDPFMTPHQQQQTQMQQPLAQQLSQPSSPLSYIVVGYNDAPVPTDASMWNNLGPSQQQVQPGAQFWYPTPPPGSQLAPPTMGYYQPTDAFMMYGGVPVAQVPPPQQQQQQQQQPMQQQQQNINFTSLAASPLPTLEVKEGMNGRELCSVVFAMLFTLAIQVHIGISVACIVGGPSSSFCQSYFYKGSSSASTAGGAFIGIVVAVAVIYLIEAWFSPFRQYSSNLFNRAKAYEFMTRLGDTRPALSFWIECFHYETRTRVTTDKDGNTQVETYTERVVTHTASEGVHFMGWRNVGQAPLLSAVKALRVRLQKQFGFVNQASAAEFQRRFSLFVARESCDVHQNYGVSFEIPGFESYIFQLVDDPSGESSCIGTCSQPAMYWWMTLLTLRPYAQLIVAMNSVASDYTFVKEIMLVP